jgi:hypothetical protein
VKKNFEQKIMTFAVEHNLSFNSLDHLTKLIKEAAKIPANTVQNLKLSRTKGTKIVLDTFAPRQQKKLAEILSKTKFSIIADESSDVSATKCLALTVRYFDITIKSQFLCLLEVPQADAKTLFDVIMAKFNDLKINFSNEIGYGADNANVMTGEVSGLKARMKKINPHIFSMGCVCHSLDLCSSAAAKTLPSSIKQFLQDVYNHFSRNAKRKFRFKHHQELCGVLGYTILRHSNTRWLSHKVSDIAFFIFN